MADPRASPRATLAELEALADQSVDEPDDRVARAPARLDRPERGQRDQCHPMRRTGVRDDRTRSDAQRSVSDADGHIPTVAEQAHTREVDGLDTATNIRHRGVGPDRDAPRDRAGHAVREQPRRVFSQRFGDLRRPPRSRQQAQHQLVAIRQPHDPRRYLPDALPPMVVPLREEQRADLRAEWPCAEKAEPLGQRASADARQAAREPFTVPRSTMRQWRSYADAPTPAQASHRAALTPARTGVDAGS